MSTDTWFPAPPARTSFTDDGQLKDTAANRALTPTVIPQHIFERSAQVPGVVYADDRSVVLLGDARTSLRQLIDAGLKVDCIMTSPPYFGQRDYGADDQIGLESNPGAYIEELLVVFGLCRMLLRDTGSLWINIGDTYWSGKGAHRDEENKQGARRFGVRPQDKPGDGLWTRPKQLLLIPHRLAIALQQSGWLVRNDNVWIKPNPTPDQARDRSSVSHEYVFHLTANRYYYYNRAAVGRRTPAGKIDAAAGHMAAASLARPREPQSDVLAAAGAHPGAGLDPSQRGGPRPVQRGSHHHGLRSPSRVPVGGRRHQRRLLRHCRGRHERTLRRSPTRGRVTSEMNAQSR